MFQSFARPRPSPPLALTSAPGHGAHARVVSRGGRGRHSSSGDAHDHAGQASLGRPAQGADGAGGGGRYASGGGGAGGEAAQGLVRAGRAHVPATGRVGAGSEGDGRTEAGRRGERVEVEQVEVDHEKTRESKRRVRGGGGERAQGRGAPLLFLSLAPLPKLAAGRAAGRGRPIEMARLEDELTFYGCFHSKPVNKVGRDTTRGAAMGDARPRRRPRRSPLSLDPSPPPFPSPCALSWPPPCRERGAESAPPALPLTPPHRPTQLIHFLFVPPILATLCVWLAYTRPATAPPLVSHLPPPLPSWAASGTVPNPAAALVLAYSAYYVSLEPLAGASWAALQGVPMWVCATAARAAYPALAWRWAAALHVGAWLIQVGVGHGLVEGRRPALTVSLGQALGTAPLFAWLEGLFAVGYRPGLQAELETRVAVGQAAMDRRSGLRKRRP